MLKEAAARQKANDAVNQQLLSKKKHTEVEQKRKLIEEHKKISNRKDHKPLERKNEKPAHLSDLLSSVSLFIMQKSVLQIHNFSTKFQKNKFMTMKNVTHLLTVRKYQKMAVHI